MIIRRLTLRDFRRFADYKVEFAPGLNLIVGNNEEGKSTLREALALALYESPKTTNKRVLEQRRWGASEQFALGLAFTVDDQEYLLSKDFQNKTAVLEGPEGALHDVRQIDSRLKDLLGLSSRALFESTVRVTQRDITSIQGEESIADSLQRTVTGGEQDVLASTVLAQLETALAALKSASRANPGALCELPARIAQAEAGLAERQAALVRGEEARRQLATTEDKLAAASASLAETEARLADCVLRLQLEDRLREAQDKANALVEREGQAQRLAVSAVAVEQELQGYAKVLALSTEEAAQATPLERQANSPEPAEPTEAVLPSPRPRTSVLALGTGLFLAGLASALWQPVLVLLGFVGFGLVAWELYRSQRESAQAAAALARAEERQRTAQQAGWRLDNLLRAADCASVTEFRARRAKGEEMQRRLGEDRARLEGLLSGQNPDILAGERRQAERAARELRERLGEPALRLAQVDQTGYLQLRAENERLKQQVDGLHGEQRRWQVQALAHQASSAEVHALAEQLEELRSRLAIAEERRQVLTLARDVLDEARRATLRSAKDVLEAELGTLVAEITGGRYRQVAVEPGGLALSVLAPGRAEPVPVAPAGELSTGTVEQIYLAARLALAKLLAQGRRPPFILDDPFVTFDAERTRATLALCRRLGAERQVLLFTCRADYAEATDHVVVLPGL